MGKVVKRLMLDDIYAIDRNESWFAAMASIGLATIGACWRLFCMTHDADLSEELAQETFYQAIKTYYNFRGDCKVST